MYKYQLILELVVFFIHKRLYIVPTAKSFFGFQLQKVPSKLWHQGPISLEKYVPVACLDYIKAYYTLWQFFCVFGSFGIFYSSYLGFKKNTTTEVSNKKRRENPKTHKFVQKFVYCVTGLKDILFAHFEAQKSEY